MGKYDYIQIKYFNNIEDATKFYSELIDDTRYLMINLIECKIVLNINR